MDRQKGKTLMASIRVEGLDDLLKKLDKLATKATVDEIAKKAVDTAAPIVEAATRSALASVETGPYATGSVSSSVEAIPARTNAYGVFSAARPTGRDAKGERNAAKAAFLQYGTSRLKARPWRQKAVNTAKGPAIKAMEAVIKAEMELE